MMNECTPGAEVKLNCTIASDAMPQVLRLCESSVALQTSTACRIMDSASFTMFNITLANEIILPNQGNIVKFTCPTQRDSVEVGGYYGMYSGPIYNGVDPLAPIACVVHH
jgi:hypothetical protein